MTRIFSETDMAAALEKFKGSGVYLMTKRISYSWFPLQRTWYFLKDWHEYMVMVELIQAIGQGRPEADFF